MIYRVTMDIDTECSEKKFQYEYALMKEDLRRLSEKKDATVKLKHIKLERLGGDIVKKDIHGND